MTRHTLTFDVDGVLADGHYIPSWDRFPEVYLRLGVRDSDMAATLNQLSATHNVYLVSGRRFDDAVRVTRQWLEWVGVDVGALCGVVCGVPRLLKARVAELLGTQLHFDDDPVVCQQLGPRGAWFEGHEWDGYQHCIDADNPRVSRWSEVPQVVAARFALTPPKQLQLFEQYRATNVRCDPEDQRCVQPKGHDGPCCPRRNAKPLLV